MDAKLQKRVQRYGWDKAAAFYERFWAKQLEPAQNLLLDMANLEPGVRVVEVASGTGLVTFRAAERVGPTGSIVATDISNEMVELSRSDAARRGIDQVTFERMDAESLSLADASFDIAICALGMMYVPSPLDAFKELRRVLVRGGCAVSAVWGARNRCGWAEIFPIVDSRVESEVCPAFYQLGTGETQQLVMESAGFADLVSERISTTLVYGSAEEACGAAFAGGPVALAYARFDDKTREEAHAEYLASIESYRDGDGYQIPGEFVVTRGMNPA